MKSKKEQKTLSPETFKTENNDGNVIIIAGREREIYNQAILDKLQKYDQIVICSLEIYLDRAIYIIREWEALGIYPISPKQNKLVFEQVTQDITNTVENKTYTATVNRITLSKQPEIFRFTKI